MRCSAAQWILLSEVSSDNYVDIPMSDTAYNNHTIEFMLILALLIGVFFSFIITVTHKFSALLIDIDIKTRSVK